MLVRAGDVGRRRLPAAHQTPQPLMTSTHSVHKLKKPGRPCGDSDGRNVAGFTVPT